MNDSSIATTLASHSELVALGILIAGVIVARLASLGVGSVLNALDRRAALFATTETSVLSPRVISITRIFFFWLILIFAISLSLSVLGISGISAALESIIEFAPKALIAFSIVVVGHLLGLVASHLISELDSEATTASVGPRMAHGSIVVIATILAVQNIGVDITFIRRLILILVGSVSAGFMLAFALGARQYVGNLLASRQMSRLLVGQRIRVGEVEGEIIEIYDTGLDIATEEGIASVPAARLVNEGLLRIAEKDDNG
jgi:hypothetical protein